MTEYLSVSWIIRLFNWLFKPFYKFYFSQPRLYIFFDKPILKQIVPTIPNAIDEVTWEGELVIKNNSSVDSFNLELSYPKGQVFDTIDKLEQHNNLSAKAELRLKFSWTRDYPHDPIGLQIRRGTIDAMVPEDKKQFAFLLSYSNEKGKTFYSVVKRVNNEITTEIFVFRPKIK